MRRLALATAVAGVLLACSDAAPPPAPPSFERPNRIAFACVEYVEGVVVPLDRCASASDEAVDEDGPDYDLHALVTQSGRGEVATVNLAKGLVVDSRRDVPGFTFVPVGELPSGIAVPAKAPGLTYVVNFGSRDLYVLKTQAFLSLPPGANPVVQVLPFGEQATTASPVDIVLSPEEDALFVAVPGEGAVYRMPLRRSGCDPESADCCAAGEDDCEEGRVVEAEVTRIDLSGSTALVTAPPAAPPVAAYERLCGFDRPEPPPAAEVVLDPSALTQAPRPVALAIDAFCAAGGGCPRRLLVADEALPIVHVLDLDALALGGAPLQVPISVGTPTRDVVVTPPVPRSLDAADGSTQYVYAIDATDGSVVALEDGRVLAIDSDPAGRPNRIPVGRPSAQISPDRAVANGEPSAAVLEVLTPGYDPTGSPEQWVSAKRPEDLESACENDPPEIDPAACLDCDHTEENPARLRGVFLAVAMSDGSVRIVDVHDMELAVRDAESGERLPDGESPCRECSTNDVPLVVRHHPRVAVSLLPEEGDDDVEADAPLVTPFLTNLGVGVAGRRYVLRPDGTTNSPDLPGLDCIRCEGGYEHLYPSFEDVVDAGASATLDAGVGDGGGAPLDGGAADGGVGDGGVPGVDLFDRCPEDTPSLLCTITDPWFDLEELWSVVYEGALPGTGGGAGQLVSAATSTSGAPELAAEVDFCAAGVLGHDDDPRGLGDQVVFTSDVVFEHLLDEADVESCRRLEDHLADDEDAVLRFPIARAFGNRLVLDPTSVETIDGARVDIEDVQRCAGGAPLAYHVRVRGAYAVVGSRSGFLHGVTAGASAGRCGQADDVDPSRTGRAYAGETFRNGRIELALREDGADGVVTRLGAEVFFSLVTPARKAIFDANAVGFGTAAVVPVELRYNPLDQVLYLIDEHDRGLVPIPLDPFPSQSTFSYE